ncbi:unnamed protein product [Blepharisma stoltei]|uniref:Uncharacterized protein n=1 Tax=Blepharisma stoltei TaxID=1481888 RepID=A0AAU9JL04_9CILI|nr:unnamed protein product [Blepharisma stoltei]
MVMRARVLPIVRSLVRFNSNLTTTRNPSAYVLDPTSDVSQFSKSKLVYHGELEDGVIPEALKYSYPCNQATLSNGLLVASEASHNALAHLCVIVKAGVRNENFQVNGIGHFVRKLRFKGTEQRSKFQLAGDVENIGGELRIKAGKEVTEFHIEVPKAYTAKAMEILADVVLSSKFNKNAIEEQKAESAEALFDTADNKRLILENIHYTAYRDHMIGQPIRGNQKSIQNITQDAIKDYIDAHYIAPRMVLTATGNVDHKQIAELGEKYFGKVAKSGREITGDDRPIFTPSTVTIRDDDVDLAHMGIFFQAPSWNHEDFYAFQMLVRLCGDYVPERDSIINHAWLQYNYFHTWFGEIEDFGGHSNHYFPYSNAAIWGHYTQSLDLSAFISPQACLCGTKRYTDYIMESELYRARNRYYNDLLNNTNLGSWSSEIGTELLYAKRRIPRSEVAKRISCMGSRHLEKTFAKWLWDCELAVAMYGPVFMQIRFHSVYRGYMNGGNMW